MRVRGRSCFIHASLDPAWHLVLPTLSYHAQLNRLE